MKSSFSISHLLLSTVGTATIAFAGNGVAQSATLNQQLTFTTQGQSMWATGSAFNFSNTTPLAVSWNPPPTEVIPSIEVIPSVCIPFTSICSPAVSTPAVTASTQGNIGFVNTFNINSGTVNATLPVNLALTLPDAPVVTGNPFSIGTSFALAPNAFFETFSPSISNKLDLLFKVAANLSAGGSSAGFNVDRTVNILDINNSSISLPLDALLPSPLSDYVSLSVNAPTVNTQSGTPTTADSLSSQGSDTFVEGALKLANIASALFGLPPLSGGFTIAGYGLNYNLFTADATLDLDILQKFNLTAQKLPASLSFLLNDGTASSPISFNIGDTLNLLAPENWTGQFQTTVNLDAIFKNTTSLEFLPGFAISALGGGLSLPSLLGGDRNFGPLFSTNQRFNTPPISVYDASFALGGFTPQSFKFAVQVTDPVSVPESTAITGLGLVGTIALMLHKRRKVAA